MRRLRTVLRKYNEGRTICKLNKLFLLASVIGLVALAPLHATDLNNKPRHIFHKKGSTEIHSFRKSITEFKLTAVHTEGRLSFVDETFLPGMDSYPGHTHKWHAEIFYVLSGRMQWTVAGETQTLVAGDLVYIPPRAQHATRVLGDEPVRALMIYEPGGFEEGYMKRSQYTPEQLEDPAVRAELLSFMDIHFVQQAEN